LKQRPTGNHHKLTQETEDWVSSLVNQQVDTVNQMPLIRIVRAPEEIEAGNQRDDCFQGISSQGWFSATSASVCSPRFLLILVIFNLELNSQAVQSCNDSREAEYASAKFRVQHSMSGRFRGALPGQVLICDWG
jgi:hypothetical protein